MKKEIKFEAAPQNKIDNLRPYVDKIMRALGHREAFISDESYVSDFLPFLGSMGRKEAFDKFQKKAKKLGIKVKFHESIVQIAKRLKKHEERNEKNKV